MKNTTLTFGSDSDFCPFANKSLVVADFIFNISKMNVTTLITRLNASDNITALVEIPNCIMLKFSCINFPTAKNNTFPNVIPKTIVRIEIIAKNIDFSFSKILFMCLFSNPKTRYNPNSWNLLFTKNLFAYIIIANVNIDMIIDPKTIIAPNSSCCITYLLSNRDIIMNKIATIILVDKIYGIFTILFAFKFLRANFVDNLEFIIYTSIV